MTARPRVGILASHPIQYQAPFFRAVARRLDLTVYFAHRQTPDQQAEAGFGVPFDWDVDLLSGYEHVFLRNVSRRPGVFRFGGCDTPEIAERIARDRFDAFVISGWYLKSYGQAALACRREGVPSLARGDSHLRTKRSSARRLVSALAHRAVVRLFDGHLAVGVRNREFLLAMGVRPDRIFAAPHGVDNAWFSERASGGRREELCELAGAHADSRIVLFSGKVDAIKRPLDLVSAIGILVRQGRKVVLAFAGSGPMEAAVRDRAAVEGVPLAMLGFRNQSELPSLYSSADVLSLPSESETWGLVVNEALACGTPVIASEGVGCAPDLVVSGRTGEIHPVGDTEALAGALARVLDAGKATFASSIAETIDGFSPDRSAGGVVTAVESLVGTRRSFSR